MTARPSCEKKTLPSNLSARQIHEWQNGLSIGKLLIWLASEGQVLVDAYLYGVRTKGPNVAPDRAPSLLLSLTCDPSWPEATNKSSI